MLLCYRIKVAIPERYSTITKVDITVKNDTEFYETISAGETASIENTHSEALSISVICRDDCRVDIELAPGQAMGLSTGNSDAKVVLHHGDPANLLIVKPESAS